MSPRAPQDAVVQMAPAEGAQPRGDARAAEVRAFGAQVKGHAAGRELGRLAEQELTRLMALVCAPKRAEHAYAVEVPNERREPTPPDHEVEERALGPTVPAGAGTGHERQRLEARLVGARRGSGGLRG